MSDVAFLIVFLVLAAYFCRWFLGVGCGAPYIPAKQRFIQDALELLSLTSEDTVFDLGSGDGRFLLAAARSGARVIGYEINPFLVWISRFRLRAYGDRAHVVCGNLLCAPLEHATAVYIFGMTGIMPKVAQQINVRARLGTRVVSVAFDLPWLICKRTKGVVREYKKDHS